VAPRREPSIVVVGRDPLVARGLVTYLTEAGFPARAARELPSPPSLDAQVVAVIAFPDELPEPLALAPVAALQRHRQDVLLVLVSSRPSRFAELVKRARRSTVALPAPVFGWALVDLVRAHQAEAGGRR
jgi:hypothetical protein